MMRITERIEKVRKLFTGCSFVTLIMSVLLCNSAMASEIPVEGSDCGEATCLVIQAETDVFVESLSLLFPEVTTSILAEGSGGAGGFIGAILRPTVKGLSEQASNLLLASGVEVDSTLYDVYFGEPELYSPAYLDFSNGGMSPVYYFEQGLKVFLTIAGYIVSVLILGSFLLKILKLGLVVDGDKLLLRNLIRQIPLIVIVVLCVLPLEDGLPVFSIFIVGSFLLGAFMASVMSSVLASYFSLYLMDGIDTSTVDLIDRAERLTRDMLYVSADEGASELSRNIFNLDYRFMSKAQAVVSGSPSRSELVSEIENIDLEKCFQGKWHLFTNYQGCERMKDYVGDVYEASGSRMYRILENIHNGGSSAPLNQTEFIEALSDKLVSSWYEREQEGALSNENVRTNLSLYVREVIGLSYKKFAARKELFCSQTSQIKTYSLYEDYLNCSKLNTDTGEFDGMYASELSQAYLQADASSVNIENELLWKYNAQPASGISESVVSALAASLVAYQFEQEQAEIESEELILKGASIVVMIYEAIRVISGVDVTYVSLLDSSKWLSQAVVGKVSHLVQPVEFSGEANPDGYLVDDEMYPVAAERSRTDAVPNPKYNGVNMAGVYSVDLDSGTNPSLFIYLQKHVPVALSTLAGLKMSLVAGTSVWKDSDNIKGSLGIILMVVNILFSISLFFFAFGFIAMLFAVVSLVVASFIRLGVHLVFIPLYVTSFIWERNDEDEDDENVFVPEKLKKVLQRSMVDPLAITVSFLFSIVVISIYFELTARILIEVAGEGVFSDNGNVLDSFNVAIQFFLKVVFLPVLAGWILFKGNSFVDYIYRKITQFITDDTGGEGDSGNELQDIKELLTRLRGLSS